MAAKKKIFITHTVSGQAFGITEDTDEKVYVPRSVVERASVKLGDEMIAVLSPNKDKDSDVPWFVQHASHA